MSDLRTHKVTITAVMTSGEDPTHAQTTEEVIEDILKRWMPTYTVEMESEELMDEERQSSRIRELEEETMELRAERYRLKHKKQGKAK